MKFFIFICFSTNVTCEFLLQQNMLKLSEIITFNPKRQYLPHYLTDKDFKSTVVNRKSLQGGSFEITQTVPLKYINNSQFKMAGGG